MATIGKGASGYNVIQLAGYSEKVGATNTVTTYIRDTDSNVLLCSGATTPSSEAGYAYGCQFINTATGIMAINRGGATTCSFKSITTA